MLGLEMKELVVLCLRVMKKYQYAGDILLQLFSLEYFSLSGQ